MGIPKGDVCVPINYMIKVHTAGDIACHVGSIYKII